MHLSIYFVDRSGSMDPDLDCGNKQCISGHRGGNEEAILIYTPPFIWIICLFQSVGQEKCFYALMLLQGTAPWHILISNAGLWPMFWS